jgi:DNA processing protein
VLAAGRAAWQAAGLPATLQAALAAPEWVGVDADLAWREADAARHILTRADPAYPPLLAEISDPPSVLFVHGDPAALRLPQLAIVGSRNPTPAGQENAQVFAAALAHAGLAITSGLALGIDAAAHAGAIEGGAPTVAVMATGPDRLYPAKHRTLAERILACGGVLITEFPTGVGPLPEHFPRRNRIISGLALGVLVVEAAPQSGSLITARCALEQGREVLAIPGSIHNPLARGCHALIRQGAKLVETAADVLEELGAGVAQCWPAPADSPASLAGNPPQDPDYHRLINSLDDAPISVDQIVARSGLTPEVVSSMLLIMELQGVVASAAGGRYARRSTTNPA